MWQLEDLLKHANETQVEINLKWVPARPENWKYRTFKECVKEAWAVFTGEAEAFKWPGKQ